MLWAMSDPSPLLGVEMAGFRLRTPVVLAAGTAAYVEEAADVWDLAWVGAVTTKSITAEPREGNPAWRILPAGSGMLNAIGLANVGAEAFAAEHGSRVSGMAPKTIGSIAGATVEEYAQVAAMFAQVPHLAAIELNVSCPNVKSGRSFGDEPEGIIQVVRAARDAAGDLPIFVKLPPVTTSAKGRDIVSLATAALDAGASGLTVANTIPAMMIDVERFEPELANGTGGLSGPAAHAVAVRLVHLVYWGVAKERRAPIIGVGGVMNWRDAAEMILAGATAVGVGTASMADARAPEKIARGLGKWAARHCERLGVGSIADLRGQMRLPGERS
jgi:dihydroorotate dehydrogenase (NAD+) catalytic subunit